MGFERGLKGVLLNADVRGFVHSRLTKSAVTCFVEECTKYCSKQYPPETFSSDRNTRDVERRSHTILHRPRSALVSRLVYREVEGRGCSKHVRVL